MSQQLSEQLILVFQMMLKMPGYGRNQTLSVWRTEVIFTIFDSFPKSIQHHFGFIYSEIHANITHIGIPLTYGTEKHRTMSFESEDWKHWIEVSSLILLMVSETSCKGKKKKSHIGLCKIWAPVGMDASALK